MAVEQELPESQKAHRRQTRTQIVLPMLGGVLLILAGVVIAALMPQRLQVGIMADFLFTVLLLCPLVICFFPLYILLAVAVFKFNDLHNALERLLGRAERVSENVNDRVRAGGDRLSRRVINTSVKIAPFEKVVFGAFDRRTHDKGVTHDHRAER
jgi:hypothetical protein